MLPHEAILAKVAARGAQIHFASEWINDKEITKPGFIELITVPLTTSEWCSLCMRNGVDYVGPCCAQTGYTQDILNDIFRNAGTISANMAINLVNVAGGHDGFELLATKDEATLLKAEKGWDKLRPLDKLFLCAAAAMPRLHATADLPYPKGCGKPDKGLLPPDRDIVRDLKNALSMLAYVDMFDDSPDHPYRKTGQHAANTALRVARAVPLARAFLNRAPHILSQPFEGFGIADADGEIMANNYGLAVYHTRAAADEMLAHWHKQAEKEERWTVRLAGSRVRPLRVSVESGLQFID